MKSFVFPLLAASTLAADVLKALNAIEATSGSDTSSCGVSWKSTLTTTVPTVTVYRPEGSEDYSSVFTQT